MVSPTVIGCKVHSRVLSQATCLAVVVPASRHTSGPLRLQRGSRCDRTGFKADIQNWVATLAIHLSLPKQLDEKVSKLQLIVLGAVLTVFAQEHADYIGIKVERPFKVGHYCY